MNARLRPRADLVRPGLVALLMVLAGAALGCERLDRYTTGAGSLEGSIEASGLVRAGFTPGVRACVELDTGKLQSTPGTVSTSDGRFVRAPLRPIPALTSDTLSNLSFADGQVRNLLFALRGSGEPPRDALAVISLLDDGRVELRVLDGAPGAEGLEAIYGVFPLERKGTRCSY